jgi:hypothetical protein
LEADGADERLARIEARYREMAGRLARIGYIAQGSLARRRTRCSTPTCACHADPPRLHGPYWNWTAKKHGKTVNRRFTDAQASLYQNWIDNDRRLRAIITEMRQLSTQATELILNQAPKV